MDVNGIFIKQLTSCNQLQNSKIYGHWEGYWLGIIEINHQQWRYYVYICVGYRRTNQQWGLSENWSFNRKIWQFQFFRYQWIWGFLIVKVLKHPVNPDETKPSLSIGDPQNSDNHHERKSILTHLHELRLHSQPRKGNRNIISIKPYQ